MGKPKTAIVSKKSHCRAKRSEIWRYGVQVFPGGGGLFGVYTVLYLSVQGQFELIRYMFNNLVSRKRLGL